MRSQHLAKFPSIRPRTCDTVPLVRSALISSCALFALIGACGKTNPDAGSTSSTATSAAAPAPSASVAENAAPGPLIAPDADHVGGVIARAPNSDSVYIADEDHGLVRFVADTSALLKPKAPDAKPDTSAAANPAPVVIVSASAKAKSPAPGKGKPQSSTGPAPSANTPPPKVVPGETTVAQETLAMGGAPANLVALRDGALVTVRDPGKLVRIRKGPDGKLAMLHEVSLAADAWGVAVNESATRALVTSAWTNTVTLVEITDTGLKKCAEVSVGREPRGVLFASDSLAYVNHLVGNQVSRLTIGNDCNDKALSETKTVVVPPSPTRSPTGKVLPASMGYSLALSPDKKRLFVPRHALGARSHDSWFGTSTVDTMLLPGETTAAPMHDANLPGKSSTHLNGWNGPYEYDNQPTEAWSAFIQPRDIRYRRSLGTVVVVSEGGDRLVELDALAMDPAYAIAALYELSDNVRRLRQPRPPFSGFWRHGWRRESYESPSHANASDNHSCAAPQGVVLNREEKAALVFCRASTTLIAVPLQAKLNDGEKNLDVLTFAKLDSDAQGLNLGRRLFYSAVLAEGMGCAGCHPEGRDDGHVWREIDTENGKRFLGGDEIFGPPKEVRGVPRRTPMLVGRLLPVGPYGWRAESETLEKRIMAGTQLHAGKSPPYETPEYYVNALGVFLRKGLIKPPARTAPLTAQEQRGKVVFEDSKTQCSVCHEPTRYFSNYMAMKLEPLPTLAGFAPETDAMFKTPSLLYIGQHGSMLHDGSAKSIDDLIEKNGTRMGSTAHLSTDDRKALVAYLKTL